MALISISGLAQKEISSSVANVEFDGYLNVTPAHTNTVSRRPIEDGFDAVDAIHINPTILNVEIIITDTPQGILDRRSITNAPNVFGTQFFKNYTQRQLDNIQEIVSTKTTISLKSKYRKYINYYIENYSYTETEEQGLRITFTMVEARTDQVVNPTDNISESIGLWS